MYKEQIPVTNWRMVREGFSVATDYTLYRFNNNTLSTLMIRSDERDMEEPLDIRLILDVRPNAMYHLEFDLSGIDCGTYEISIVAKHAVEDTRKLLSGNLLEQIMCPMMCDFRPSDFGTNIVEMYVRWLIHTTDQQFSLSNVSVQERCW